MYIAASSVAVPLAARGSLEAQDAMGLATVSEGIRMKWTRVPDGEISQRDGPQAAQKFPHI